MATSGPHAQPTEHALARLVIDRAAIRANYGALRAAAPGAETAATVKADAYGLGLAPVAETLSAAGCRTFFVATPAEALQLKQLVPVADVHLFSGPTPATVGAIGQAGVVPVLNSLDQLSLWQNAGGGRADLMLDTGMTRLGIAPGELNELPADFEADLVMSHLASSEDAESGQSEQQLANFVAASSAVRFRRRSLANSGGVWRGRDYHFDLVRPGIHLYGGETHPESARHLAQAFWIEADILQVRDIPAGTPVSYNGTWVADRPTRLATVALGYADGLRRSLGNCGRALVNGRAAPIRGRVTMDLTIIDVSDCGPVRAGDVATFFGPAMTLAEAAAVCSLSQYELLTGLGRRYDRHYL